MRLRQAHFPTANTAFTLIEIMTSVAISTLLIIILSSLLNKSTDVWAKGQKSADVFMEARASLDYMRQDLEATIGSKETDFNHLTISNLGMVPAATHIALAPLGQTPHLLSKRYFVPFEVNRVEGTMYDQNNLPSRTANGGSMATGKAFGNAIEGPAAGTYHPNYSAIAFLTQSPLSRQVFSNVERGYNTGSAAGGSGAGMGTGTASGTDGSDRNKGDVCVAGYYAAYTYDSPIPGAKASMKVFRHFRDSGTWAAGVVSPDTSLRDFTILGGVQLDMNFDRRPVQSRSHILVYKLAQTSRPLYEKGIYDNATLPFLLKPVHKFGRQAGNLNTIEAFPANAAPGTPTTAGPDYTSLPSPPPALSLAAWDPWDSDDQYYLKADEPIAFNVVRFRVVPMKFANSWLNSGAKAVLHAADVNSALATYGLSANGGEWPAIITPDLVDIELTVIDDATAGLFQDRSEWENWETIPHLQRLVKENSKTFRTRIQVRGAQWSAL